MKKILLKKYSICYDKMSKKKISWKCAEGRIKIGLKNTFWIVVDSKDYKKLLVEK